MNISSLLHIALLACMWGPSYLFIKISLVELPPLTITLLRILGAALVLLIIVRIKRVSFPKFGPIWGHLAFMGCFACVLPFTLFNIGEQRADSALAAIINGLVPLLTAVFAHFFIADERLSLRRICGIFAGLIGFLLLLLPTIFDGAVRVDLYSIIVLTLATVCYGGCMVYGRRFVHGLPTIAAPAIQFILATFIILPIALIWETPWRLPMPSLTTWLAVGALSIFGTALAFVLYFRILANEGAVTLSMVTYLLPLIGIILGVVFLDEYLIWYDYLAVVFILLGMIIISGHLRLPWRIAK